MPGGYAGKILRLNLTTRDVRKEPLDWDIARKFIGGRGLAAKIIFDELAPMAEPLGPDNKLVFATGPVTGCPVPGAGRLVVVTKSPATHLFLDTYAGTDFAPEMKFAGYDVIVIEGSSRRLVYAWINNDSVEIIDAPQLRGKDCWQTEKRLKEEVCDKTAKTVVIGLAGENLVRFAAITTDTHHQCGRGGAGAVMGSKNLKGVVIRGAKGFRINNSKKLLALLSSEIKPKLTSGPQLERVQNLSRFGNPLTTNYTQLIGILPTRNFQAGQFERYEEIDGYSASRLFVSDRACYSCCTPCYKISHKKDGPYAGVEVGGPQYETVAMFGSNLGIADLGAILEANACCDRYGLDTISTGNVIGFAMECYEKGILTKKDTAGIDLQFGNAKAALAMIHKIAHKEGLGELLSEGVRAAADKIGKGSKAFAMHGKGLEFPAYEPRASPGFALAYAVADRGACHRRAWPARIELEKCKPFLTEGRAQLVKDLYDERIPMHCILVCDQPALRAGIGYEDWAKIMHAVTGWDITPTELRELSDRVASLVRAFNVREGHDRRADATLPIRVTKEPQPVGPGEGHYVTERMLEAMLDEYYLLRGWDKETGIPTRKTLERLDLKEVADELECHGLIP